MRWPIRVVAVALAAGAVLGARAADDVPVASADVGITLDQIATGLSNPVAVVDAGDGSGRLFIVEQTGAIRLFAGGAMQPGAFLDIAPLISCCGEQGLLGLAFHPQYETNGRFFVNYTDTSGATVIARYTVSPDPDVADASSAQTILTFSQPFSNHNGGDLHFGPDGYLYISSGDGGGGGDPSNYAQDVNVLLGKMLRIDVDAASYTVPPSNPLVGQPGLDEIWAVGLRNPWRFSFDRATGDMFIADVGQASWEEVDLQPAGDLQLRNYGWRRMEGSACYDPPTDCQTGALILPIIEYSHAFGCAITGGYRYRGGGALLYGYYLYADFCSGRIWGASESGGDWTSQELLDTDLNVSAFGEDADGELYVLDLGGGLYRILPGTDIDGDLVADSADNCPTVSNAAQADADSDALGDACEALYGTDAGDRDTDADGCADGREVRVLAFTPANGGDRDPLDGWDFFDVSGDVYVDLTDALDVLSYFGAVAPDGSPADRRDRGVLDPAKPWRSSESDDGVDLTDALVSLQQFGHDCTGPP